MPDLDPSDWAAFARTAHGALDDMIAHLRTVRDRPVWTEPPTHVRQRFETALPRGEAPLDEMMRAFMADILPHATGNGHPLFMGWVHGAGTPVGMLADMLAAGLNANCGGRNHIGLDIEKQITKWSTELFGFPAEASGILVTGTSMANLLGLVIARHRKLGGEGRMRGAAGRGLVAYTSSEAHGCIARAMEVAGLGSNALRLIAVDHRGAMDCATLAEAIARDRRAGLTPFLLVGTAGSVNRGAIDPLERLADIASREDMSFHVDGAFGALIALSERLKPRLAGIERASSIAFDFHKWGHVPYDAGFLLVRDENLHRDAFTNPAAYLARSPEGLGAGDTWPCDLGVDLSRGFRALKVWMTFKALGADRIAAAIEDNCRLARLLARQLEEGGLFDVVGTPELNIVCFALKGDEDGTASEAIVTDLQLNGRAAPSLTTLDGRKLIRCAIVNHRCTDADIADFLTSLQVSALRVRLKHLHAITRDGLRQRA